MELIKANNHFLNIPVYDIDKNRSSMQISSFEASKKIKERYSCMIDPEFCKSANEDKKFYVEIDKSKGKDNNNDNNKKHIESKPKGRISQICPNNFYSSSLNKRQINLENKKKKDVQEYSNNNSICHKNASNSNDKKIEDESDSNSKSINLKSKSPKGKPVSKFKNHNAEKNKEKNNDKNKDKSNDKNKDKSNEKSLEKNGNKKNIQTKSINKNYVSFNDVSNSLQKNNNRVGNKKDNNISKQINKDDSQFIDNNSIWKYKSSKDQNHKQEVNTSKHKDHIDHKDHHNGPKILNINIFQTNPKHKSDNRRSTQQRSLNHSNNDISIDESIHKKKTNKEKRKNKKSTFQVSHENFITYPVNIEIRPSIVKSKFDISQNEKNKKNEEINKDEEEEEDKKNKSSHNNILIGLNNGDNKELNVDDIDNSNEIIINKEDKSLENSNQCSDNKKDSNKYLYENKSKNNLNSGEILESAKQNMQKSDKLILKTKEQLNDNKKSNNINDGKEENKSKNTPFNSNNNNESKGKRLNLSFNNGGNRPSINISNGSGFNYIGKKENENKKKSKKLLFCCIPFDH